MSVFYTLTRQRAEAAVSFGRLYQATRADSIRMLYALACDDAGKNDQRDQSLAEFAGKKGAFQQPRDLRLKVGLMDLRLVAVAVENSLTVVTRNVRDFNRVPGVRTEDWSV